MLKQKLDRAEDRYREIEQSITLPEIVSNGKEYARLIKEYKSFEHIVRLGEYYNLAFPTKYPYSAYYYTTESADEMLLTVIEKAECKAGTTKRLKIKVAQADATYTDVRTGKEYSGEALRRGITVELLGEKDSAHLFYFKKN